MNELAVKETMTSKEIAEITGKRHADVLRDIRNIIKKGVSEVYFTEAYYTDAKGETRPMYNVSIDGLSMLNQHYSNKKLGEICGQKVLVHATRFEVSFGNILIPILDELGLDVEKQLVVGDYRIDFYIPKLKVAIEYDEEQHNNPQSIFADKTREEYLNRVLGCKFIRVSFEDSDAVNVGKVLSKIVKVK